MNLYEEFIGSAKQHLISMLITRLTIDAETDEQLAASFSREDKSLEDCYEYIYKVARKGMSGNCAGYSDNVILSLAKHYFLEDDPKEDDICISPVKIKDAILDRLDSIAKTDEVLKTALTDHNKSIDLCVEYVIASTPMSFRADIPNTAIMRAVKYYKCDTAIPRLFSSKKPATKDEPIKADKTAPKVVPTKKKESKKKEPTMLDLFADM